MQERFKVVSEKKLVKNMTYLMWESKPRLSVHEADTLPTELMRFYIYQVRFEPTTFRTTKTFRLYERKNFKLCEKKKLRFCNLNHLGNLILGSLANLVNLLNWVLAILVHFAPFWFILGNWVYVLAIWLILVHFS